MSEQERALREALSERRLTVHKVARRLGVNARTVVRWIRSGKLRAVTTPSESPSGRRYRVLESDLRAFERAREVSPDPDTEKRSTAQERSTLIDAIRL